MTILHVLVCIFLMLTVLLQAGKGGGMGAAFGGGATMGTVFGGSGAGNFLRRLTVVAAVIFMVTSMTLAWMATPSTDPLKEYWAQQQAAASERERAHNEATSGQPAANADDAAEESGVTEEAISVPEGEEAEEAGAPAAGEPEADKGAADKGAADKGAADKPAVKSAPDKPATPAPAAAPEPAKDKPAPAEPAGTP
ncbi:MAG TPA: preprotein translocase subunit SecG [Kofleriaceae bacterium]|nr:preprotein translocase subunit SecG [Kofleriaceae bacterium]